ncbi:MlaD family protein [Mycolicibacterium hippocampi]|uniref:Mammalian cell entry protein n=1 Tax=Mycolicibacterium hippocampi TaxID=659824 RepID=A0A7I9ZGE3_9MYCO|nr:mammalian cell entry protein [Mycolicibacterium hippocampi]
MPALHVTRRTLIRLVILSAITAVSTVVMTVGYMRMPELLFGVGRYQVGLDLPSAGGLYPQANVTYRGTKVGQVTAIRLNDRGVRAELSLKSSIPIPSDLTAEVHSQTALGEQYVDLLPRNNTSPPLENGNVIADGSVPPDINSLLDATNRGLQAVPEDNLRTVIDESYVAFGGLGPEIARIVKGSTALASDARRHLDDLTNLVDNSAAVLDTQTDTAGAVREWAANLATITNQLQSNDDDFAGILEEGPAAFDQSRALLNRLQPTLPVVLANLATTAPVLIKYHAGLEQLLVLLPMAVQVLQGTAVAEADIGSPLAGLNMNLALNLNLPPPCLTGYLPPQQVRPPAAVDTPDRPAGNMYCRVPQDSPFNVRGVRNIPCAAKPGKRAPTAAMCDSEEDYVPLNDGFNWKGDPNATLSGQDIPQLPPTPTAPVSVVPYDPATGSYIGPDGKRYTQSDLAPAAEQHKTWQSLLIPPSR